MSSYADPSKLAAALVAALSAPDDALFDALYGVEGVRAQDKRALVMQMRDETKAMFEQARAQLDGATLEVGEPVVDGDKLRVRIAVVDGPTIELVVDDLHEHAGKLRTRDVIQLNVV